MFVNTDREWQLELIKQFCQNSQQNGGVMLISGPRGSGKSRLLDEALTPASESWWSKLRMWFGATSRSRLVLNRGPRQEYRHIIKVNVDPYFPYSEDQAICGERNAEDSEYLSEEKKEYSDRKINELGLLMLRNIVFALTSEIDPRLRWRHHGRTLIHRLGFWSFLIPPFIFKSKSRLISLGGLCVVAFLIFGHDWGLMGFLGSTVTILLTVVLLRLLDWRALDRIGRNLYDLAHAQELEHSDEQLAKRWDFALYPQGGVSNLVFAGIVFLLLFALSLFFSERIDWHNLSISTNNIDYIKVLIAFFMAFWGATISIRWYMNSRRHVARYGNQNPAWMVTLLRRYVFIAHKCGIEPVLVFDELDKLENHHWPRMFSDQIKESQKETQDKNNKQPLRPIELFFQALLRFRESSGAGFLIILVVNPSIHWELRKARRKSLHVDVSMEPWATLIQQEIFLGPMGADSARKCVKNACSLYLKKDSDLANTQWQYLYLRSHGLYSNFLRLLDQEITAIKQSDVRIHGSKLVDGRAKELCSLLNQIWLFQEFEFIEQVISFEDEQDDLLFARLKDGNWHRIFVQAGMIQFCYDLIEGRDDPDYDMQHIKDGLPEVQEKFKSRYRNALKRYALIEGDPEMLKLLGRDIMYRALVKNHQEDRIPSINPPVLQTPISLSSARDCKFD